MKRNVLVLIVYLISLLSLLSTPSLLYSQSARITDLALDTSPADTDEHIVQKSGESRAKKQTAAQVRRFSSSTTLPSTCTVGDPYWDTNADTDGSLYVCRATNIWKEVDDDGGSGGAASNSFETFNAPSGTDPVADSAIDTLNLTCTGLSCTGNSSTDTLALVVLDVALGSGTTGGYAGSATEGGAATSALAVTGFTPSRCARFDDSGNLVAATGDCTAGDTGGGGAPTTAQYLTLATDATLTVERVLTPGLGLTATDAGAGGAYTVAFKTSDTLAANPTLSAEQTVFTADGTGGGLLFEGLTADTIEGILTWSPTTADRTLILPDVSATLTPGDSSGSAWSFGEIINAAGPPYNAVCDDATTTTSALQAAIDAAPDDATIYIPPGICRTGQLTVTAAKDLRILGAGINKTVLKAVAGATGPLLNIDPASRREFEIGQLSIDLSLATTIAGFGITSTAQGYFHDLRVDNGTIGFLIADTANGNFERLRAWNQSTAGVQIDGDTSAELYFTDIDIQRNIAGTTDKGFEVVRSLSADGGAYYLYGVRITRNAGTVNYGFHFNQTGGTASGNPVFMSKCVADNVNGTSSPLVLTKQQNAYIMGSWFVNGSGGSNPAILIDGGSAIRITESKINPNSSTGSGISFTNAPADVAITGNEFVTGIGLLFPATSLPTGLVLRDNNLRTITTFTNDLAALGTATTTVNYSTGLRIFTNEAGAPASLQLFNTDTSTAKKTLRTSAADRLEVVNSAFSGVIWALENSGDIITTATTQQMGSMIAASATCISVDTDRVYGDLDCDKVKDAGEEYFDQLGAAGGGETNTASNLGGGLANYSTKVGVDLRFNSFDAADFELASNLVSIDDTKWSTDAQATTAGTTAVNGAGGRSLTCSGGSCDVDVEAYELTKCMLIESPASGDDLLFFRSERAATITGIDCLVVGGTSVAVLVKECDTSGGTCGNTEASITCGTTNTTETSGIDDSAIDAGDWMRIDPGTVTGSVTQLSVCVTYQVAD